MTRNPITLILAFSLILAGFSAMPARAGNGDLGKLAMGAFGLFVLGNIINNSNKQKITPDVSRGFQAMDFFGPAYSAPSYKNYGQQKKSEKNKGRHSKINKNLPGSCFFNLRTPYGPRGVYGKKCLNETMRHADRLPMSCRDNVRIRYGQRADIFTARCLSKHGYRTAKNRH